jgi:hypothetical protein
MAMHTKKVGSHGGFVLSRGNRNTDGVFVEIRGPRGGSVKVLDRGVYEKAAAKAGKTLRSYVERRPKGPA